MDTVEEHISKGKQMQTKQKYYLSENHQKLEKQGPADKEKQREKQGSKVKIQHKKMQDPTYKEQRREQQEISEDEEQQKHFANKEQLDHSADKEQQEHFADKEQPKHSADTEQPVHSADKEQLEHSADKEQPEHSADKEQPEHSADKEQPEHSADKEQPEHSADKEQPEHSADKEQPEHSADKEQQEHSADKEQPKHSADKEQQEHPVDKKQKLNNRNSVEKDLTGDQLQQRVLDEKWSLKNKAQYDYSGEDLKFEQLKIKFNNLFKHTAANVQHIEKIAHHRSEQVEYANKLSEINQPEEKLFEEGRWAKNNQNHAYTATVEGISWKNQPQGSKQISIDLKHFKKELDKFFTPSLDKRLEKDKQFADVDLKSKNINSVEKDLTDNQLQQHDLDEKWSLINKVQYDYSGEDLKFEQLKIKFNKLFKHIAANVQQIDKFAYQRSEQVEYANKLSEMNQPEKKLFEEGSWAKNNQNHAYTATVEGISSKNQPKGSEQIAIDLEHFKKELHKIFTHFSGKRPNKDKITANKEQQKHCADVEKISKRQDHIADVEQKTKQQDNSVDNEQKSKIINFVDKDLNNYPLQLRDLDEKWFLKNKAKYDYSEEDFNFEPITDNKFAHQRSEKVEYAKKL